MKRYEDEREPRVVYTINGMEVSREVAEKALRWLRRTPAPQIIYLPHPIEPRFTYEGTVE